MSAGSVHCGDTDVPALLECEMCDGSTSWIHICLQPDGAPWKLGSGAFGHVFKVRAHARKARVAHQVPQHDELVLPGQSCQGRGLVASAVQSLRAQQFSLSVRGLCQTQSEAAAAVADAHTGRLSVRRCCLCPQVGACLGEVTGQVCCFRLGLSSAQWSAAQMPVVAALLPPALW